MEANGKVLVMTNRSFKYQTCQHEL